MPRKSSSTEKPALVQCRRLNASKAAIGDYVAALKEAAPSIGNHGLSLEEFWESGLFRGAIERIRGTQSATMSAKRDFMTAMLGRLVDLGFVREWRFSGAGERHDYEVIMDDGRLSVIETKGCLDGNNTTIYERPPNAEGIHYLVPMPKSQRRSPPQRMVRVAH